MATNVAFDAMRRPEISDMTCSDIPDTAGRKTSRKRTQAIAKRYTFHANAITRRKAIAKRYTFQANAINYLFYRYFSLEHFFSNFSTSNFFSSDFLVSGKVIETFDITSNTILFLSEV